MSRARSAEAATASRRGPLEGVRVVAWEQAVAGPLATRNLADLGADVIKIERPSGGDFTRSYDSSVQGLGAHFVWLNRGKRSVVLDLRHRDKREALLKLVKAADVFVHNQGPGVADRFGLEDQRLLRLNPRLIVCVISGFGRNSSFAARKAYDMVIQGEAGLMALTGTPDRPMRAGMPVADIAGGMYALSQILVHLYERASSGEGGVIDVALYDCLLEWITPELLTTINTGRIPVRSGDRHLSIVPYGSFPVRGGELVNVAVQNEGQWHRFCVRVLLRPELELDPRYSSNEARVQNRDELEPVIEEALAHIGRSEVEARLSEADVPFGLVRDLREVCASPPLSEAGHWIEVESSSGVLRVPRSPLDEPNVGLATSGVPDLGAHSEEVLRALESSPSWPTVERVSGI